MINCADLESILANCEFNPIGGIDQRIYINDSSNISDAAFTLSGAAHTITALTAATDFEIIEFRKNLAQLDEPFTRADDGATIFTPTLTIPVHGRDAQKSRKISLIAAGQREVDIIVPQNDGGYVYLRKMQLASVADGTMANKADASKYTLVFDGQAEHLSYFITEAAVNSVI